MSILVRFSPASLTAAKYDEVNRRIEEAGHASPDGREYHCCFGTDGNLKVSEIWDSEERFRAYGEHLMPILAEAGIEPGQPEVLPVHNTVSR
jgi:hypothetical protein